MDISDNCLQSLVLRSGLPNFFPTAEYEDEDYFRTQVTAVKEVHAQLLQPERFELLS